MLAGAVTAGIYTTNSPSACQYIVNHSESHVVVCDGVKQLDKFLAIQRDIPTVKALVLYNEPCVPDGIASSIPIYTFESFLELGAGVSDAALQERMDAQRPGHCCSLIYTSGTTGDPKAVMISHDNVTWTASVLIDTFEKQFNVSMDQRQRIVSYLPLSHIAAQMLDLLLPACCGAQLFFAEPDALKGTLGMTLKEVRPTIFFGVPRVWEKIAEKMVELAAQNSGLKARIGAWAKSKGAMKTQLAQFGQSGGAPCGYSVANALVLHRVKQALGLDDCFACFTAAAPIKREIIEYFGSLDLPVFEFFGMSEVTGPQTLNFQGQWKIGTCGRSMPGVETRVVEDTEELVFRGRNVMMGYLKAEDQTRATIDEDGWLHSGDCGALDADAFMAVTGRIKELIITSGGENVPPLLIESCLKEELPLLSHAMVVGDQRKFLTALFTLRVDVDNDGNPTDNLDAKALSICKEIGSSATTVAEAKADPAVQAYLEQGLMRANTRATSHAQNVGKFAVLDDDFSAAGGELTATLKVRRQAVLRKYAVVIDAMYD
ncbi:hypothetical protein PINS_up008973 [Pythium insidiosum]|nr:hypothetical protein PINS_up008973 [Pythium insidiosum]